jgi:hypothetical protein
MEDFQLIDFNEAKDLPMVHLWLQIFGERWKVPARIVEGEVTEYDGIWQTPCTPADPPAGERPPRKYLLVDRVTGRVRLVGNGGPKIALFHLLASRHETENR